MANTQSDKSTSLFQSIISIASFLCFMALSASVNRLRLWITALIAMLGIYLLWKNRNNRKPVSAKVALPSAAILCLAIGEFYSRWLNSSKAVAIASRLSMQTGSFLLLTGSLLGLLAFYGVLLVLSAGKDTAIIQWISKLRRKYPLVNNTILSAAILLIELLQIQKSCINEHSELFEMRLPYFFINMLAFLMINAVLFLILRRFKTAIAVGNVCVTLFSLVNYYVVLFHGSPLFPSEFANTATAFNVIASYRIPVSQNVVIILGLFLLELVALRGMLSVSCSSGKKLALQTGTVILSGAVLYTVLFGPLAKKDDFRFSWQGSVRTYGFVVRAANNLKDMIHPIKKPKGYDKSVISIPHVDNNKARTDYPDIILIVNESFCDLDYYADVEADVEYLNPFFGIEGACYGYSFASEIGGGTNNTEFELLTSDAMSLLNNPAPFNYIRFHPGNSTFLSYLKDLGYETTAMHSRIKTNYSRHIAYPAMGFDHLLLGEGSFSEVNRYGNRLMLDEDEYAGMLALYSQDADGPRFYYLLTYQNHGGYEQNDPSYDMVHTGNDFGSLTDDVDEYLTSVGMSANAFHKLIDQLSTSDRDVIVCMVGDHAPFFISELQGKVSGDQKALAQRAVPYIIWANFDCAFPEKAENVSMTDLIPLLLSYANMPLTPYYQQILYVHAEIPIRTEIGLCMDTTGEILQDSPDMPANETLRQYYYMAYLGLTDQSKDRSELFRIP